MEIHDKNIIKQRQKETHKLAIPRRERGTKSERGRTKMTGR